MKWLCLAVVLLALVALHIDTDNRRQDAEIKFLSERVAFLEECGAKEHVH